MKSERKAAYRKAEHMRRMMKERTAKFKSRVVDTHHSTHDDDAEAIRYVCEVYDLVTDTKRVEQRPRDEQSERIKWLSDVMNDRATLVNEKRDFPFLVRASHKETTDMHVSSISAFTISFEWRPEALRRGRTQFPKIELPAKTLNVWHKSEDKHNENFVKNSVLKELIQFATDLASDIKKKQEKHFKKRHNGRSKRKLDL